MSLLLPTTTLEDGAPAAEVQPPAPGVVVAAADPSGVRVTALLRSAPGSSSGPPVTLADGGAAAAEPVDLWLAVPPGSVHAQYVGRARVTEVSGDGLTVTGALTVRGSLVVVGSSSVVADPSSSAGGGPPTTLLLPLQVGSFRDLPVPVGAAPDLLLPLASLEPGAPPGARLFAPGPPSAAYVRVVLRAMVVPQGAPEPGLRLQWCSGAGGPWQDPGTGGLFAAPPAAGGAVAAFGTRTSPWIALPADAAPFGLALVVAAAPPAPASAAAALRVGYVGLETMAQ